MGYNYSQRLIYSRATYYSFDKIFLNILFQRRPIAQNFSSFVFNLIPLLQRYSLIYIFDFIFPNLIVIILFLRARILFRSLILSSRILLSNYFLVIIFTVLLFRYNSGRGSRGRLVSQPGYFSPVCFYLHLLSSSLNIFSFSILITLSTL